jgi:hypothetical protein
MVGGVACTALVLGFETTPTRAGQAPRRAELGAPGQGAAASKPLVSPLVHATARLSAVDHEARTVTVATDDGAETTVEVPAGVKMFDRLRIGDRVGIDYYDSLVVSMRPSGAAGVVFQPAANRRELTASAEIEVIDLTGSRVTLRGPHGQRSTVAITDPDLRWQLPTFRPGQIVEVRYTPAVAVAIRRARR